MVAIVCIGNIAIDQDGDRANYRGLLVVPLALALWPTWMLFLRRKSTS